MDRYRVYVLDDHEIVRFGLREVIQRDGRCELVGEGGTVAEALRDVPRLRPDVALLDVRLPDGDGADACAELTATAPDTRCLIFTTDGEDESLLDGVVAGATGFVRKEATATEIVDSLVAAAAGRSLLDPLVTARVMRRMREGAEREERLSRLTEQERRILDLVAEGLTNRQIAEAVHLAEKTVKNYVSNLLAKLGMERRTQAAVYATRLGQVRRTG